MIHLPQTIVHALEEASREVLSQNDKLSIAVSPCHDIRFGDYQSNLALLAAKHLGKSPRELAQKVVSKLTRPDLFHKVEVAGAGFINFHLNNTVVEAQLSAMTMDRKRNGIRSTQEPRRMVIDFSSPNIAKSMHVGHIRSTFLGDSLARMARAVGHHVITDNHLGDWGTQFGKLIYGFKKNSTTAGVRQESPIAKFERYYKETHEASEKDLTVLTQARQELVKLQSGDPENTKIWKEITALSLTEFRHAYERMGITFDHYHGESFYNSMLEGVVSDLRRLGLAEESEGATCVFFREAPELKNAAPMIIQKSDGAALYATTDLATIHYRCNKWNAEEILYVTDARQQLHFRQLFSVAHRWMELAPNAFVSRPILRHIVFGSILGSDKKPIKTRSGDPIKLKELLDEAEFRTGAILKEKNPTLSEDERENAARVLGIGALKYADLCQNRNLDYVFDWDKLLALQGNTAPYLIYAYVRIRSIFRNTTRKDFEFAKIKLSLPEEMILGKHLIQFGDVLHTALEDYRPHILCTYLYELASKFSRFYESCPVLKANDSEKSSRLALCNLTATTLQTGLNLLGINTLERM